MLRIVILAALSLSIIHAIPVDNNVEGEPEVIAITRLTKPDLVALVNFNWHNYRSSAVRRLLQ